MVARFISSNLNRIRKTYISSTIRYNNNFTPLYLSPNFQFDNDDSATSMGIRSFMLQKRWHTGHSHSHHDHDDLRSGKNGERIFRLGLAADIGLAASKAFTGYICGSTAIIADAAHSISDVVLSGVALLSFKAARVPKDKEHPYGHGKFETLGALGISGVLLATAGGIGWHALDVLLGLWSTAPEVVNQSLSHLDVHEQHHSGHHHGIDMDHPILALNVTILSIAVKEGLYWITKRAGDKIGSGLMKANAWHHRADAVSSVVALIGVGGSILGVRILDPLAGLVVAGMIMKAGLETGYQSVLELVDAAIPSHTLKPFKLTILQVDGVKGCSHLRGRRAGSYLYLDVIVEVDPFSSVSAAHEIGENVRREIQQLHPEIAEVFVHIEPSTIHIPPTVVFQQRANTMGGPQDHSSMELADIENIVYNILSTNFSQKMIIERVTPHLLQGQILLQVEVSMPPDLLIRDAEKVAEEAEKLIIEAAPDIVHVCIQLRLGQPMPEPYKELVDSRSGRKDN
ncbi:PREDICTED: metal tolerance protein 2 isoform X1 [Nicotiana attenuata]|uniref:Metal tolerance protein c1 n=1 Tax=Nicotiana attenuata TaxID=49451 RepID=A0A1J6KVQ8_NICAT|nr:PREDICTED: metal tolerance protein 2 isoform X1 [Nicotiana attenuata]OIT26835.1 metal tolerance protein c1 [Nicotiana attenuata]